MAKKPKKTAPITEYTHTSLIAYVNNILTNHKKNNTYLDKFKLIDYAYYMYQATGEDNTSMIREIVKDNPQLEIPVAMSQVDSVVGYLADIFAVGHPPIGVIGPVGKEPVAEKLEALFEDHANRAAWPTNLLQNISNNVRYNFAAMEVEWAKVQGYKLADSGSVDNQAPKVEATLEGINKLNNIDPWNTIWDQRFTPEEANFRGDFIGYAKILSNWEMRKLCTQLSTDGIGFNTTKALESTSASMIHQHYVERPTVSQYIAHSTDTAQTNWADWVKGLKGNNTRKIIDYQSAYLMHTMYVRIVPNDHGMYTTPNRGEPQTWKLRIVNGEHIISAEYIPDINDRMPMILSSIKSDGYGLQTPSIAESILPFQDAASDLLNVSINAARRAIGDRAIYDTKYLRKSDVDSTSPVSKIPLQQSLTDGPVNMNNIYHQIPFESSSVTGATRDMNTILGISELAHGLNSQQQGANKKGNRTLGEVEVIANASNMRSMLLALHYEYQVMTPIKVILKFNTLVRATKQQILSPFKQKLLDIDPTEFRETVLEFKLADGLVNKANMMAPEVFASTIQYMMNSQTMNMQYDVDGMVVHLAHVQGAKGLDKFKREEPLQPQQEAPPKDDQSNPAT